MNMYLKSFLLFGLLLLASCGGKEQESETEEITTEVVIDSAAVKTAEKAASEIKEDSEELDSLLNEL